MKFSVNIHQPKYVPYEKPKILITSFLIETELQEIDLDQFFKKPLEKNGGNPDLTYNSLVSEIKKKKGFNIIDAHYPKGVFLGMGYANPMYKFYIGDGVYLERIKYLFQEDPFF